MKIGLLFSGQGAQQVGMGADLYAAEPAFKATIDEASAVLGYDLADLMANDADKVGQTQFAQPAILAMSIGILRALGDVPVAAGLGLSLGEYSALTAAGVLSFDQAVALIKDRGAYMQAAGDANPGKMVAVMTDDQALVEKVLGELQAAGKQVYAANYNTFQQLVIGGIEADVDEAIVALEAAGVSRMVPLAVSGAFHTPLLAVAGEQFAARIADETFAKPAFPVYSNTTGAEFVVDELPTILPKQLVSPTYFAQALQKMLDAGVDTLIEVGPSDTLSKFARKIADKGVKRLAVTDVASLATARALLAEG